MIKKEVFLFLNDYYSINQSIIKKTLNSSIDEDRYSASFVFFSEPTLIGCDERNPLEQQQQIFFGILEKKIN